jgi:hypothetical protein
MSLTMSPEAHATFNSLCRRVARDTRGPGLSLNQISDCAALARELEKPGPDPERVEMLRGRLGLEFTTTPEEER